jgi:hypothetical protein
MPSTVSISMDRTSLRLKAKKLIELQLADSRITRDIYRFMFRQQAKFDERNGCLGEVESQVNEFARKIPGSVFSRDFCHTGPVLLPQ